MNIKREFSTEVGLNAIWDSKTLARIDTWEKYQKSFVENADILELMNEGSAVVWGTGGDSTFDITIRINPEHDLTEEERQVIQSKALNLKLVATSERILVGSPEGVGKMEESFLKDNYTSLVEGITPGNYLVNVYFLYDYKEDELYESDESAYNEKLRSDPDFFKTGFIVVLKRVGNDYVFPKITEFPQLG